MKYKRFVWAHYNKCLNNSIINSYVSEFRFEFTLFPDHFVSTSTKNTNRVGTYFNFFKGVALNRIDVIVVSHPVFLLPLAILKMFKFYKIIYFPLEIFGHQMFNRSIYGKFISWIWFLFEKLSLPFCDLLISQNKYRINYFIRKYNYKGKTLQLTNVKKKNNLTIRKTYDDSIGVIYAGLITKGRYIEDLIKALDYLPENFFIVLCGKSEMEKNFLEDRLNKYHTRLSHLGSFNIDEQVDLVNNIKIGFLAYENNCLNNIYSAPSKIFDYINNELLICTNNNMGIKSLLKLDLLEAFDDTVIDVPLNISEALVRAANKSNTVEAHKFTEALNENSFPKNLNLFTKAIDSLIST